MNLTRSTFLRSALAAAASLAAAPSALLAQDCQAVCCFVNDHVDAAVLQQGQSALVEQLFQAAAALAFVAQVAVGVSCEIAIRRVEPQKPESLARDHSVHQVTVNAAID